MAAVPPPRISYGLVKEIAELCTAKGWREDIADGTIKNGYVFGAYIALGHSELTEALEARRDGVWSDTRPIIKDWEKVGKPIGVGPELADTIIRVLDMCDIWGIDINHEIERVLAYGWTRPYKHGGREL